MSTCTNSRKRSLVEVTSCGDSDTLPTSKKVKLNSDSTECTEQTNHCTNGKEHSTNGNSNYKEKVDDDKEDDSWVIDPDKPVEDFRNYKDSKRQDKVENLYKEQHSKMTYDFVMQKREEHLKFNKCVMTIWDMLQYLNQVIDDSDPDTNLTQIEHAIQTGEAARELYPGEEYDWFHVTAFIHDLGKILAVTDPKKNLKGEPQWCVVGDNFPVGCQFSETNIFHQFFDANPDAHNKKYNTFYGMYSPKCGLHNVVMSWGHDEYMYNIAKSQSKLPEKALYMLRFHSFYPWHNKHGYMHLCNDQDLEGLQWVKKFQKCDLYSKSKPCPKLHEVQDYYKSKIEKYFPNPVRW